MTREFVPYELAVKLEKLGFDEPCIATHGYLDLYINTDEGHLKAPLFQQAFRWFRANGFLIHFSSHDYNIHDFYIKWQPNKSILSDAYDTYEESELACLEKLIEITETKQQEQ
jgi:hypothetical protein